MPANIRRFVELGLAPGLAKEVAAAIDAGSVSANSLRRLAELGMIPRQIRELRNQLATPGMRVAKRWAEIGFAPRLAMELVAQVGGSGGGGGGTGLRMIASNRFRTGRDWYTVAIASGVFGYTNYRIRTANSTTDGVFEVANRVYDSLGMLSQPAANVSADNKIRRFMVVDVTTSEQIPVQFNGVDVSPETGMVPLPTGAILLFTPKKPLLPNREYDVHMWDECPVGNARPYQSGPGGNIAGDASRSQADAFDAAGTLPAAVLFSSVPCMTASGFYARGITGPSVVTFNDSLEDQDVYAPGQVDGGYLRAMMSSLTGGFIPNKMSGRYSASGNTAYTDNFAGQGRTSVLGYWDDVAAALGQPNAYPFNRVIWQHFTNNAGTGRATFDGFYTRLMPKFTAPGARIIPVTPMPRVNQNADFTTDEATQVPFTVSGGPFLNGGEIDLYDAAVRSGFAGRTTSFIDIRAFVKGVNDRNYKVPAVSNLLKIATGSTGRAITYSGTFRVGENIIADPKNTQGNGAKNLGRITGVPVDNGNGTFTAQMTGNVTVVLPVDTPLTTTNSVDGTHPGTAFLGDMANYAIANEKAKLA